MLEVPSKGPIVRSKSSDSEISRNVPPKKKQKTRNQRVFDSSKYSTRFIALKIAYLGQKYNGFEHHSNNPTPLPTIEEILWKALVKTKLIFKSEDEPLNWEDCEYSKCGRTDKGVSAFGQVIGLRVRSNRPKEEEHRSMEDDDSECLASGQESHKFDHIDDEIPYPHLLNRVLPPDVRVLAWCPEPPPGFSARFSCRQRKYRYFFTQPAWYPVTRASKGMPNHWRPMTDGWLDVEGMAAAAKKFEGTHDFRNFCKQDPTKQLETFERRIDCAEVVPILERPLGLSSMKRPSGAPGTGIGSHTCLYSFNVAGSAFLWHQVRHLVAILFLVGQGYERPDVIDQLLDIQKTSSKPVYDMANDRQLVLWDCVFPDLNTNQLVDSLEWVYPGHQRPTHSRYQLSSSFGEGRSGPRGILEVLWEGWYTSKINETLAGELLNFVSSMDEGPTDADAASNVNQAGVSSSVRLFDGSGSLQSKGKYVPLMDRSRLEPPEVVNRRWLEKNKDKYQKGPRFAQGSTLDSDE